MISFDWEKFAWWVCFALVVAGLGGLLLVGLPGALVYVGWQAVLNVIFKRSVIAELSGLGGGSWVVAICMSFLTPFGLPLGYIIASLLPIRSLNRFPLLGYRNLWLVLFAILWSLILVFYFSEMVWEAKLSEPSLDL